MSNQHQTAKTIAISLIVTFLFLVGSPVRVTAQQVNFSGKWLLNESKSEFGRVPPYAAVKQWEIRQDGSKLFVNRVLVNARNEETKSSEEDFIDGKPHEVKLAPGNTKINTISWQDDKSLKMISEYKNPTDPTKNYTLITVWTLGEDGKTLLENFTSPTYSLKAVYDKQ